MTVVLFVIELVVIGIAIVVIVLVIAIVVFYFSTALIVGGACTCPLSLSIPLFYI